MDVQLRFRVSDQRQDVACYRDGYLVGLTSIIADEYMADQLLIDSTMIKVAEQYRHRSVDLSRIETSTVPTQLSECDWMDYNQWLGRERKEDAHPG